MLYRTVFFAWYASTEILNRSYWIFWKHICVNGIVIALSIAATEKISLTSVSYMAWFFMALKVAILVGMITVGINFMAYRREVIKIVNKGLRRKK